LIMGTGNPPDRR